MGFLVWDSLGELPEVSEVPRCACVLSQRGFLRKFLNVLGKVLWFLESRGTSSGVNSKNPGSSKNPRIQELKFSRRFPENI